VDNNNSNVDVILQTFPNFSVSVEFLCHVTSRSMV